MRLVAPSLTDGTALVSGQSSCTLSSNASVILWHQLHTITSIGKIYFR